MSWLSIFAVVFLVLWLRERHRTKQLSRENEALRARSGPGASTGGQAMPDDGLDNRELGELRERIQVLERIATDHNSSEAVRARAIADEIESLRGDMAERRSGKDAGRAQTSTKDMDR